MSFESWTEFEDKLQIFFNKLIDTIREKKINNSIMENLRKVADSATYVFEVFISYIVGYTHPYPSIGYLEEKRKEIIKWLDEIRQYGYEDQRPEGRMFKDDAFEILADKLKN